jgi:transposase-like protein
MTIPPFCPNPACQLHTPSLRQEGDWYTTNGWYGTEAFGTVRRFRCLICGKGFSEQTFSIDYYAKRTLPYQELFHLLYTTSSIRDMARAFHVKPDTVLNKLSRLARNCLERLVKLSASARLAEDLVADGFENFTVSQFFPCSINFLVGKQSQYVYWFDHVTIRRKGRMTEIQKQRRNELERIFKAESGGIRTSFHELVLESARLLFSGERGRIRIYTDEHKTYDWVMRKAPTPKTLISHTRIDHIRIPSTRKRTVLNPLFSVNYIDRQLRKDIAECVRETVCFGRNVANSVNRLVVYLTYHNLFKPYREQQKLYYSHAGAAGFEDRQVAQLKEGLFSRRSFLGQLGLEGPYRKSWLRQYPTPLKKRDEYLPEFAAA